MNIKEYWEKPDVVSMTDPRVSKIESSIISSFIKSTDTVLDIGCGDGSGSYLYRDKCSYLGVERSKEMICRYKKVCPGVKIIESDMMLIDDIGKYSVIVCQRSLINLENRSQQRFMLKKISDMLLEGGKLILCEAFEEGLSSLNLIRVEVGLKELIPHWHATYLNDSLVSECLSSKCKLIQEEDLSVYFLMTRVLHASLVENPSADSLFNEIAEKIQLSNLVKLKNTSFIKVQVWERK